MEARRKNLLGWATGNNYFVSIGLTVSVKSFSRPSRFNNSGRQANVAPTFSPSHLLTFPPSQLLTFCSLPSTPLRSRTYLILLQLVGDPALWWFPIVCPKEIDSGRWRIAGRLIEQLRGRFHCGSPARLPEGPG